MSWTPFNTSTDITLYDTMIQLWAAARERCWALGADQFPQRVNSHYYEGTITSMTATKMTDSTADWPVSRWVGYVNPSAPWEPSNYDVVLNFEDDEPSRVIKAQITAHTDKELTINSIQASITQNWITSASFLVGKRYAIIKRGGLDWIDFWPTRPNDALLWNGVTAGVSVTYFTYASLSPAGNYVGKTFSGTSGTSTIVAQVGGVLMINWLATAPSGSFTILDGGSPVATGTVSGTVRDGVYRSQADFPSGAFNGKDILFGGTQRISITSNDTSLIKFSKQSSSFNATSFVVLSSSARGDPGRKKDYPFIWYHGAYKEAYTKYAGNDLFSASSPATVRTRTSTVTFSVPGGVDCLDTAHDATDKPVWSETDEECSEADKCYTPDLYKSLRGLQAWIEQNCIFFMPVKNYTNELAMPPYSPAMLFRDIGAGYMGTFTGTVDGVGDLTITVTNPESDTFHWSLYDERGEHNSSGVSSGTTVSFTGLSNHKPYSLIAAKGWTRRVPRTFAHVYPRSVFIPDVNSEGIEPAAVAPPTEEYPGTWEHMSASTNYAEFDDDGFRYDTGPSFITNGKARYRGDNWRDPVTDIPVSATDVTARFWRDAWMGRFEKGAKRDAYDAMKKGNTAYGSQRWFRQTDYDWWGFPIGIGAPLTHSGTATSGSSTSLTDTNKTWIPPGDVDPVISPFWNSTDNGPRFIGMMLEVDKTVNDVLGNPQTVTYHTPITGHSDFTINFTSVGAYTIPASGGSAQINVPSLTVTAGTVYRIKEPRRLNWFKGQNVVITKGVTSETKVITHHDDEFMWFDSNTTFTIDETCKFKIVGLNPGYVYKWDGLKWVETSTSKAGNLRHPDTITKYGKIRNNDYVTVTIFQQLVAAFNKLVWVRGSPGWTSREDPDVEEKNYGYPTEPIFEVGGDGSLADWEVMKTIYESYFDGVTIPFENDGYPPSYRLFGKLVPTESELGGGNSFAYGVVEPPRKRGLNRAVDFYALAWVDSFNHEQGETTITTTFTGGVFPITSHAKTSYVFDPQGGALIYRAYSKYAAVAANYDVRITSSKLGHSDYVAPIDAPEPFVSVFHDETSSVEQWRNVKTQGYYIADHVAIIRWNVPGGFTYVGAAPAPFIAYGSIFGDDTPIAMDGTLE